MAKKRDRDATPAMKALTLYSLLVFTGRRYSLIELADILGCSKPTVLRLVQQIESTRTLHMQVGTEVVGRQRYYWSIRAAIKPNVSLTAKAIQSLVLCHDMLAHLLPAPFREEINAAINQTTVLLDDFEGRDIALTSVAIARTKGAVDYSPHQETIAVLLEGLHGHRIVDLVYRAHDRKAGKAYAVAPLQLVTHRDSIYLRARREKDLGKKKGFFDPTLAVHRIEGATLTKRTFTPPAQTKEDDYSVFGFMPGERFAVAVTAQPPVVPYLRERIWSHDQVVTELPGGGIEMRFSATSESEVVSWVLGFAGQMTLQEPAGLRARIAECGAAMAASHG